MVHFWEQGEIPPIKGLALDRLLHALLCAECRDWLIASLLIDNADDDTKEEIYAAAFRTVEDPGLQEAARQRRNYAELLLAELQNLEQPERLALVKERRFHDLDLLELLLEHCHAIQVGDPGKARELAEAASRLSALLSERIPEASFLTARAYCLGANAHRLRNDLFGAEQQLARASAYLVTGEERAFYSQTAALIRWEGGRPEEAFALLRHATYLFQLEGSQESEIVCTGLKGLLLFEENRIPDALPALHRCWKGADLAKRPVFSLRVGLVYGCALAFANQKALARQIRQETWKLLARVNDPLESVLIYGLEGRMLGLLGEFEEAEQVLRSVRQRLLDEALLGDAALAALDLAWVLAQQEKRAEIELLSEAFGREAPRTAPMDLAVGAVLNLMEGLERGQLHPWEEVFASESALRRIFRSIGVRLRALPFA